MKALIALLAVPTLALAAPPPEVLHVLGNAIRPGIRVARSESVEPCAPAAVDLVGTDPITFRPRHVEVADYRPRAAGGGAVLVIPPTGGENFLDRAYAADLCGDGIHAVILRRWEGDVRRDLDLGTYDRAELRLLAAAEHAIEYLQPAPSLGILGTSLGALGASLVLGYDARVKTGVLIVGGEHLSEIIAHTDEPGAAEVRRRQMRSYHLRGIGEYEAALRRAIRIEPADFTEFSGRKNVLLFLGTRDTTVPTKNQLELARSFSAPELSLYPGDHVQTIQHAFFLEESACSRSSGVISDGISGLRDFRRGKVRGRIHRGWLPPLILRPRNVSDRSSSGTTIPPRRGGSPSFYR
jgi:hypothetical protein